MVPVVDSAGKDPTGRTINVFKLTSDPGARKFELANSNQVFTDVNAISVNLTKRMTRWYANAGVTGFAQTRMTREESWADKLAHDMEYIADRSVRLYLTTVVATGWRVLKQSLGGLTGRRA